MLSFDFIREKCGDARVTMCGTKETEVALSKFMDILDDHKQNPQIEQDVNTLYNNSQEDTTSKLCIQNIACHQSWETYFGQHTPSYLSPRGVGDLFADVNGNTYANLA